MAKKALTGDGIASHALKRLCRSATLHQIVTLRPGIAAGTGAKLANLNAVAAALLRIAACAEAGDGYGPRTNWSGMYIGANAGWLYGQETDGIFAGNPDFHWNSSGGNSGTVGVHGGVQHQWGNVVVGIEVGYSGSFGGDWATTVGGGLVDSPCGQGVPGACQTRIEKIWQAGGRLGWATDRWMLYGTGGFAAADIKSRRWAAKPDALSAPVTTSTRPGFLN